MSISAWRWCASCPAAPRPRNRDHRRNVERAAGPEVSSRPPRSTLTARTGPHGQDRRRFLCRALHAMGRAAHLSAIPATASTACSARCSAPKARSSSSRCGTRRWPPSWPRRTPSSPASSASASPPRARAPSHLITGLYDAQARSHAGAGDRRASRRARRSAATTSRRSTCQRCSRTSPAPSCSRRRCRRRCAI